MRCSVQIVPLRRADWRVAVGFFGLACCNKSFCFFDSQ